MEQIFGRLASRRPCVILVLSCIGRRKQHRGHRLKGTRHLDLKVRQDTGTFLHRKSATAITHTGKASHGIKTLYLRPQCPGGYQGDKRSPYRLHRRLHSARSTLYLAPPPYRTTEACATNQAPRATTQMSQIEAKTRAQASATSAKAPSGPRKILDRWLASIAQIPDCSAARTAHT
jgi:hypothetical protein